MSQPGTERVQQALREAGVDAQVVRLDKSARTAQLAADAIGPTLGSIVKTLVFPADGERVLVLVAGDRKADPAKLKDVTGAKRVMIADADRVREATGFSIGGVAPVGYAHRLPVWIDDSLGRFAQVYAAAGHPHAVVGIGYDDLVRVTTGQVADVTK